MKKILLLVFFFILIYKPEFIFIPHSVNMFLGVLGLLIFVCVREYNSFYLNNGLKFLDSLAKFIAPFVVVSFFSIVFNGTCDFHYPRYAISLVLCVFATYFIAFLFYNVYGNMSVEKVIDYFVFSDFLFLLIGLFSFFFPELYKILISLQKLDVIAIDALRRTEGCRLVSIGAQFFSASIINGFVLVMIGLKFYCFPMSMSKKIWYALMFVFIFVIGMMMGRTTIIGGIIGLVLIVLSFSIDFENSLKTFFSVLIVSFLAYLFYDYFILGDTWDFNTLSKFGFEMFDNYQNGHGFTAHSNKGLFNMYKTLPDDLTTWLVGDARWNDGDHYYMHVDSGYLRGLWYFGVFGLIALIWYFYKTIRYIVVDKRIFYGKVFVPFAALFLYVLILNYKGPTDLFFCLMPFVFCNKYMSNDN